MLEKTYYDKENPILAWHFTKDRYLGHGDGRMIRPNHPLVHREQVKLCISGLHASENILSALRHASGTLCWRVECSGETHHAFRRADLPNPSEMLVCERRKPLWVVDAKPIIKRFLRWSLLTLIHHCDVGDAVRERLWKGQPDNDPLDFTDVFYRPLSQMSYCEQEVVSAIWQLVGGEFSMRRVRNIMNYICYAQGWTSSLGVIDAIDPTWNQIFREWVTMAHQDEELPQEIHPDEINVERENLKAV